MSVMTFLAIAVLFIAAAIALSIYLDNRAKRRQQREYAQRLGVFEVVPGLFYGARDAEHAASLYNDTSPDEVDPSAVRAYRFAGYDDDGELYACGDRAVCSAGLSETLGWRRRINAPGLLVDMRPDGDANWAEMTTRTVDRTTHRRKWRDASQPDTSSDRRPADDHAAWPMHTAAVDTSPSSCDSGSSSSDSGCSSSD